MMRKRKGYPVYPLTAAQKFHIFYQDRCPKKEVLNIGTSLTIEMELDREVLRQSIRKAYERCDSMRLRFAKDKEGNWYQYVVDSDDREIEFVAQMDGCAVCARGFPDEPDCHDQDAGRLRGRISAG